MPCCFSIGCKHTPKESTCKFYRFPINKEKRKKWDIACRWVERRKKPRINLHGLLYSIVYLLVALSNCFVLVGRSATSLLNIPIWADSSAPGQVPVGYTSYSRKIPPHQTFYYSETTQNKRVKSFNVHCMVCIFS